MLKKSMFVILAALAVTVPALGSDVAEAQSTVALKCLHDGNPKHFRPECNDPVDRRVLSKVELDELPNVPRNQARFDPDNLFDQMMRDSGGGAGGGGGR